VVDAEDVGVGVDDGIGDDIGVGDVDGVGVDVVVLYRFSPLTCTGVVLFVVVPSPNWPLLLSPQAQTVPSDFRATV